MPKARLLIALILFSFAAHSQDHTRLAYLNSRIQNAQSDTQKIAALAALADYYAVYNLNKQSDSVLQIALSVAEISEDRGPVVRLVLNSDAYRLRPWSTSESFQRSISVVERGIRYAEDNHDDKLEALAYIKLATIYRYKNQPDRALENTSKAMTALENERKTDSIRVALYFEIGDIYLAKSDAVTAYKNFNTAFDIAHRTKNIQGESDAYRRFSDLYQSFNDSDAACNFAWESVRLDFARNNKEGLYHDYISLAKITDDRAYIEKAEDIGQQLRSEAQVMEAKQLMYYWYMVKGRNTAQAFAFIRDNPDVATALQNADPAEFEWEKGFIYKYADRYDSALFYFNRSKGALLASANSFTICEVYSTLAETYLQAKDTASATPYYERAFEMAKQVGLYESIDTLGRTLARLDAVRGNFSAAYADVAAADAARAYLQGNIAKDKLVLLGIQRANKAAEADRVEAAQTLARRHNLEIIFITLMITVIFLVMMLLGMFEVSKTALRLLGYFAFICLFEFIVVLLDGPIDDWTHGAPLKIWLIKICIIAILAPLQHLMEHTVIEFLQSRKLLEARRRFAMKKIRRRKKLPTPVIKGNEA